MVRVGRRLEWVRLSFLLCLRGVCGLVRGRGIFSISRMGSGWVSDVYI